MKKFLYFVLLSVIVFSLDVSPEMVDVAKRQYGITDAQIQDLAQQYVGEDANKLPLVNKDIIQQKKPDIVFDTKIKSENKNDFSSYVSAKFPDDLKQFGYDIFNQIAMTFTPLRNIPVARDYVLGPGDELKIYLWGNIQQNFSVVVDAQGNIELPRVGRITVSNLSLDKASKLIETELSKHFANFTLEVSMGQLKTIPVFILGSVEVPGKYNVDSLSTALHALYAAGGPTKIGSLRNIRVIRDNKTIRTLDLYDLFLYGDNSADILLRSGDIIFVSNIGSVAAIKGAVKNPAIFEIKETNNLYDLIKMAGEYTRNSYVKDINIIRKNEDNSNFELKTVSFASWNDFLVLSKKIQIKDGDLIEIISLSDELRDWIEIKGEVKRPGQYSGGKAKNLAQLLNLSGGLTEKAYLQRANIYRLTENNRYMVIGVAIENNNLEQVELKEFDKVIVYSNEERNKNYKVTIKGEVNKPTEQDYFEGITIRDLLFLANDYTPFADKNNIQVLRKLTEDENKVIELKQIDDSVLDTKLKAFDEVYIRKSSEYEYYGAVALQGRVKHPGTYPLYKNETFTQLVERAGGFREDAFIPGIVYTRVLDDKISKETEVMDDNNDDMTGIKFITEIADVNRLKVDFGQIFNKLSDKEFIAKNDVLLRDGDVINVPLIPQEIRVFGGVYNPGPFMYVENRNMDFYLGKAGNFRKDADPGEVYIVKADGTVVRTSNGGQIINRGDSIVVPTKKYEEINFLKLLLDWTQVIFNVATTWAVIFK